MSRTIAEVSGIVADLGDCLRAAHPDECPQANVVITHRPDRARMYAYLGKQHWSEPCDDGRFADAAFRLRTRIAAEYRPEEGEAA